jgi:hypothetical protein
MNGLRERAVIHSAMHCTAAATTERLRLKQKAR